MKLSIYYFIPLLPIIVRLIVLLNFRSKWERILTIEAQDRNTHRTHIMTFAGFTFSALLAVALLEKTIIPNLHYTLYYLLISFLFFVFAYNIQGYKDYLWQDQLATALTESATLSLICSVIAILIMKKDRIPYTNPIIVLAAFIWVSDHFLRVLFFCNQLSKEEKMAKKQNHDQEYEKRELDYILCPKHGERYLKGTECPQCKAEKKE